MDVSLRFSPLSPAQARLTVLNLIHQAPRRQGLDRSRWWLDGLRQIIDWLRSCTLAGIWQILKRLGIRYRRGRQYLHSPDPAYAQKLQVITEAQAQAQQTPTEVVFLYQDEMTYYRRPSVSYDYAPQGSTDPRAVLGVKRNALRRIAACLDVQTGQLLAWQRKSFDRQTLRRFFHFIQDAYPQARRIYIALDNWPVHFHPQVLQALAQTNIILLPLPTYAPWTNPVEKVWHLLKQQLLHLHDFVDNWDGLKNAVQTWLDDYAQPSPQLLKSVGL